MNSVTGRRGPSLSRLPRPTPRAGVTDRFVRWRSQRAAPTPPPLANAFRSALDAVSAAPGATHPTEKGRGDEADEPRHEVKGGGGADELTRGQADRRRPTCVRTGKRAGWLSFPLCPPSDGIPNPS